MHITLVRVKEVAVRSSIILSLFLFTCLIIHPLQAQILWDEDGVPIRQGKHIEWYRSADSDASGYLYATWSDCRTGSRDIYAQKYDTDGQVLWAPEGVHVVEAPGRQEDPVIVADGSGGAIIAWVEVFGNDKCNVYCQKLDPQGNILWAEEGVLFTESSTAFSPVNITTDGAGGAYLTWKDERNDETYDIYLVRVTSEGNVAAGWPQYGLAVCETPGEQSGTSIGPDGSGGTIITWKDKRSGTNYDIYVQRVSGDGTIQWQSGGELVCGMAGDQDQVKLWSDGNAGAFIVWRDRRGGSYTDIYAQRVNASGEMQWTVQGEIICGAEGNQEKPRLVHDGTNGAIFTWKDHRNNPYDWDIYAQRVNPSGAKMWSPDDIPVCTAENDQIEVRLTLVGTGEAVFVWVDQRTESSPLGDIYAQRVNSLGTIQWSANGKAVCVATNFQFSPLLRSDASGGVFAIWGDYRSGSIGIYAQRLNGAGSAQWNPTGQIIVTGISGNATHLQTMEGTDGAIMIWEDGRRGSLGTYVYAQKIDIHGSAQWTGNGVGVDTSAYGSQSLPTVVGDGGGGAFFAWEDRRDGIMQIYTQRFTGDGTLQWPQAVRVCVTTNEQEDPQVAPDGQGGVIIAWSDYRDATGYDIYVQRLDDQGNILWTPDGIRVSTENDAGKEFYVSGIAEDGNSGAFILWEGGTWDNQDIYILRVDGSGDVSTGWPEGGLPVCAASGLQVEPELIPDGEGGAVVIWEDGRNGAKDIYAQKVDSNGNLVWRTEGPDSLNGYPVCQAQNEQSSLSVVGNVQSGFYIAWQDFRDIGNGNDIYVQKLSAAGAAMWETDGVGITTAEDDQFYPALAGGTADGIFVTWEDNRSDISIQDVYAQRLNESGATQWTANGVSVIQYAQKQIDPHIANDGEGGAFIVWEDMRSKGKADTHDIYAQRVSAASSQMRGDVTNDGNINVLDILATLNHILGIIPLDENGQWRADCTGDEQLNVLDALGIANVILGIGTCAP